MMTFRGGMSWMKALRLSFFYPSRGVQMPFMTDLLVELIGSTLHLAFVTRAVSRSKHVIYILAVANTLAPS